MRIHVVDNGPNLGYILKITQNFLFRGTNYKSFQKNVENGYYWGSYDKWYGFSTFVTLNIDGASDYCGGVPYDLRDKVTAIYNNNVVVRNTNGTHTYLGNRPLLLAIVHEKYPLVSPADEGLVIPGKINLDDIVIIKTENDLLNVLPSLNNLDAIKIQEIKRKACILS